MTLIYVVSYDISRQDGGYCREGMISHFQGWKDSYYSFTTRPPSLDAHGLVLSQSGIIPMTQMSINIHGSPLPTFHEALQLHYHQRGGMFTSHFQSHYQEPFLGSECEGLYCTRYSSNLKSCVSYLSCDDITYFRIGNANTSRVELIVVGNEDSLSSGALEATLNSWSGDKVIVIQYYGSVSVDTMAFVRRVTGEKSPHFTSISTKTKSDHLHGGHGKTHFPNSVCVVLVHISSVDSSVYDKTLFNIGMDIATSAMVLLSHAGFVFPPHLHEYLYKTIHSSNLAIIIPALFSNHAGQLYQMSKGNMDRYCGFANQPNDLVFKSSQITDLRESQQSAPMLLNASQVFTSPLSF